MFVGSGAPRGRDLDVPGRKEAAANIHIGLDWLSSVSFGHITKIGKRVIVLGGGNTAMDCCRTARRLGGDDVKVIVRSGFDEMKASPWEKEDAMGEDIPILNMLVPKEVKHEGGKIKGVLFEKVKAEYDAKGRRSLMPSGEPDEFHECDDVLVAIGQENAFPWIEKDAGIEFDRWGLPKLNEATLQSTQPKVFFGGDAAFGPKNIIWAAAHGHDAAISIHKMLIGENVEERPAPGVNIVSQKMGIHEWSYDNAPTIDHRFKVPHRKKEEALKDIMAEVELGFDPKLAFEEARALPELRRADGVRGQALHRVRRLRRHLPDGLHHLHRERRGEGAAHAAHGAGDEPDAGPLYRQRPQDRPRDGEGRGRLPALRPVRRALPDRRLGYAQVLHGNDSSGARMPQALAAVNDFVVKFANVNGSGSASANELFARSILRMGVPSARATSSRRTSRACRPGTRSASPRRVISAGAAAST